jgi:hypothetical protein
MGSLNLAKHSANNVYLHFASHLDLEYKQPFHYKGKALQRHNIKYFFMLSVQQSSFYGYTSMLPSRYTQAVMTGESKLLVYHQIIFQWH